MAHTGVMALSRKLLSDQEQVLLHMRTHVKALIAPTVLLIIVVAAAGLGLGLMPSQWTPWGSWAVVGLAVVLVVLGTVHPWLNWLTTTYTVTDRRIITRRGILQRSGHDIPLHRINDVSYERGLVDRMLGCGTLVLSTAAEDPVTLPDVPHVEQVHVQVADALFASHRPDPRSPSTPQDYDR